MEESYLKKVVYTSIDANLLNEINKYCFIMNISRADFFNDALVLHLRKALQNLENKKNQSKVSKS